MKRNMIAALVAAVALACAVRAQAVDIVQDWAR